MEGLLEAERENFGRLQIELDALKQELLAERHAKEREVAAKMNIEREKTTEIVRREEAENLLQQTKARAEVS